MWQMLKEVSSQRRTENFHGIQQHKWKFLETWKNVALLERWKQGYWDVGVKLGEVE